MKAACEQLCSLYENAVYLLLLIAKSASNEEMWSEIISHSKDLECFGKSFYCAISRFDITSEADTMLKKNDTGKNTCLKWYEYLEYQFEKMYNDLDDIVLRYQSGMSEELIDCLYQLKKSGLFEMILGKGISTNMFYSDLDGNEYKENIPISLYCNQASEKVFPVFAINNGIDGANSIRDFISCLNELYVILCKYVKDERTKQDTCIKIFTEHRVGKVGSSVIIVQQKTKK